MTMARPKAMMSPTVIRSVACSKPCSLFFFTTNTLSNRPFGAPVG